MDSITLTNVLIGLVLALLANAVYSFFFRVPLAHLPGPWFTRSKFLSVVSAMPKMLQGKRHEYYTQMFNKYGTIFRSDPTSLVCADPAVISAALATSGGWPKDPQVYLSDDDGTRNLFSHVDPELHKDLRRKLSPAFSIRSLNSFEPIIVSVVTDFLQRLETMAETGNKADFLKLYGLFTGDVIGTVAFGDDWGLVKTGHSEVLEHSEKMVRARVIRMMFGRTIAGALAMVVPFIKHGEMVSAPFVENYAMKIVQDRRSGKTGPRDDLLQRLVDAADAETGEKLTDKEVANNCLLLIVAGDETTAHQLSFATYHLLSNPDKLSTLLTELDLAAKSNNISPTTLLPHSILKDLPYLDAVIHESLRLLPTTFGITRRIAPENFQHPTRPDIFIPKGARLEVINGLLSRDASVFPEPTKFLPERWLGEKGQTEADVKWNWLPFARGPRNCIGSGLAMMEMKLLLANVFRRFELEIVDRSLREGKRELKTGLFLTMAPLAGELDIVVRRRK